MAKYTYLATDILDKIGGKENVKSVFHCVTRLRFKLKDESIAKTEEIKKMDGVVTVMQSGGQYQVARGSDGGLCGCQRNLLRCDCRALFARP